MAFTLRITFDGLCVFFPENHMTEVVLVRTPSGHHSAHTAEVSLIRGTQQAPVISLPLEMDGHDIDVYDEDTLIDSAAGGGARHDYPGYPSLRKIPNFTPNPKLGVRRRDPIAPGLCSARISIFDGTVAPEGPTKNEWELYDADNEKSVDESAQRINRRFVYERPNMNGAFAKFVFKRGGRDVTLKVAPEAGVVHLLLHNRPHHDPACTPGIKNRSPHFGHVFNLYHPPPDRNYVLQETEPCREPGQGANIPCVGTCNWC